MRDRSTIKKIGQWVQWGGTHTTIFFAMRLEQQHWLFCVSLFWRCFGQIQPAKQKNGVVVVVMITKNGLSKKICQPECHDSIQSYPSSPANRNTTQWWERDAARNSEKIVWKEIFCRKYTCASQPTFDPYNKGGDNRTGQAAKVAIDFTHTLEELVCAACLPISLSSSS